MSEPITVSTIVREYLAANGYGGLLDPDTACSCTMDDLMPCDNIIGMCQAAYAVAAHCTDCDNEDCGQHGDATNKRCLTTEKPEAKT